MHYVIKYAMSAKHPSIIVDLSKNGNKYIVSAWNRGEHRTIERRECERYEDAEIDFYALTKRYECETVKDCNIDAANFDFD